MWHRAKEASLPGSSLLKMVAVALQQFLGVGVCTNVRARLGPVPPPILAESDSVRQHTPKVQKSVRHGKSKNCLLLNSAALWNIFTQLFLFPLSSVGFASPKVGIWEWQLQLTSARKPRGNPKNCGEILFLNQIGFLFRSGDLLRSSVCLFFAIS